jgi:hypothetical protein
VATESQLHGFLAPALAFVIVLQNVELQNAELQNAEFQNIELQNA